MKRRFSYGWLVPYLLANVICVSAVCNAETNPSEDTNVVTLTLPNGDAADVYFPKGKDKDRDEGRDKHRDKRANAFPIVVVLQGAQVDKSFYEEFGRRVARHGFVVVIPNHFRSLIPGTPPALFTSRTVITNALAQLTAEDTTPTSPLYRIVDTNTLALAGHSFGGVVGLFASAAVDVCLGPFVPPFLLPFCEGPYTRPAALRATAFYGTSLVQNGVLLLDLNTTGVATALVQGSLDGRSPLASAELTYPTLEHPRALIVIEGANHYGICDENNPPGAIPDPTPPTLEQKKAVKRVAKWTALWLQAQLLGDQKAEKQFDKTEHGKVMVRTD
jgi:dienelactone hydrolase